MAARSSRSVRLPGLRASPGTASITTSRKSPATYSTGSLIRLPLTAHLSRKEPADMEFQRLNPERLHKPIGCHSQVRRRGTIVAASGMASIDEAGEVVAPSDVAAQTRQTIRNLEAALAGV